MTDKIRVTVWNEFRHEKKNAAVAKVYPNGMHAVIADALRQDDRLVVRTATLDEPEHGLAENVVNSTDVMFWWGHTAHGEVSEEIVKRVQKRVLEGMGLVVLHSGHFSKIFKALMGTNCSLKWREVAERERVWNIEPSHPITQGIGEYFELPNVEMYGERFDIPDPDKVVFISWYEGGEVFRSGVTFQRGHGKIFYFSPGHETYPIYHNEQVRLVLRNAANWAAPVGGFRADKCPNVQPLEKIAPRSAEFGSAGILQESKL